MIYLLCPACPSGHYQGEVHAIKSSLYRLSALAFLGVFVMGARRPACNGNNISRGLQFDLSGTPHKVFCERCTDDPTSGIPANTGAAVTGNYYGDEESLLIVFPSPLSIPIDGDITRGRTFSVFSNGVAGNLSPYPAGMSFSIPMSFSGVNARYRSYDRGRCSWFLNSASHGALHAQALDDAIASSVSSANAGTGVTMTVQAQGPWTLFHSIRQGTWTSGTPPVSIDTRDLLTFSRRYRLAMVGGGGEVIMVVTGTGRLATSSPGTFLFLNAGVTITNEFGGTLTYPGYPSSPVNFPTFVGRVSSSAVGSYANAFASRFTTLQISLSLPPVRRTQLYPTGAEFVLSEDNGDTGDTALLSHPSRASYCGATRMPPVPLFGAVQAQTGVGAASVYSGSTP
jgi:hypothetical protein